MVTRTPKLLHKSTSKDSMATKKSPIQKREDFEQDQQHAAKHQPVSNGLTIKLGNLRTIEPLTDNQNIFFDAYKRGSYAFVLYGSAGTGKSMISLFKALEDVLSKETPYKKLVIVRSSVPSRQSGFLPGSLEEKNAVYEEPYKSICQDLFGRPDAYDRLVEQKHIEFISTSYLRGATFNDCIIFFDEFQNENWNSIKTVISRTGTRAKLILSGDYAQNDLTVNKNDQSGFEQVMKVIEYMNDFDIIKFTTDDIVRSSFTKNFLIACEKLGL